MSWLLDTNVVSASFQPGRHPDVLRWLHLHAEKSFLSVVTLGELERGVASVSGKDPIFGSRLRTWQNSLESEWADRVLPCTLEIARLWGRLSAKLARKDVDLLIAATAIVGNLTVVTRNVQHFAPTGVALFNPWSD